MKNPTIRYLAWYLIRALLGTILLLFIISAVRILLLPPDALSTARPPWNQALVLPDQLVNRLIGKTAQRQTVASPYAPQPTHPSGLGPSQPGVLSMPSMPNMPDTPGALSERERSSIPNSPNVPSTAPAISAQWGVTLSPMTTVYGKDGKRIGKAMPGALLKVHQNRESNAGKLLICSIVLNGKARRDVVIRERDVMLQQGQLAHTTPRQRDLCKRLARLLAQLSAHNTSAPKDHRNQTAAYKKAASEYRSYVKKCNALIKEYEASTGPRRMEVADTLRLLKHDKARLLAAYKAAKQEQDASQPTTRPRDPAADAKRQQLRQAIATLEKEIATL
jgi:predicted aconitase with swiveling domain